MIGLCVLLNVVLFVLAIPADEETHNPGFYLKMAKSIPRIGRRSGVNSAPLSASKRNVDVPYRKVIPFDPNMLFDGVATVGGAEDLKFVSWKDFDIALESDMDLFGKLAQLAKSEGELDDMQHLEFQQFVPMYGDNGNRYTDETYYRFQRNPQANVHKERIEYQN